jgi:hypothetical protein
MEVLKMENKKLYYAGIALQKDLEFCEILKEVENTRGVYILSKPEEHEVIEMKYIKGFSNEREATGKTHTGYDYHYITFLYNGLVFSINAATYYPFTDTNDPGRWNFVVYELTTPATKTQATYSIKYEDFNSINKFIDTHKIIKPLRGCNKQNIDIHIHYGIEKQIKQIVNSCGGYREKEIYNNGCFFDRAETWNNEHKVINVLSILPDEDGYRSGFAVDLITGDICG